MAPSVDHPFGLISMDNRTVSKLRKDSAVGRFVLLRHLSFNLIHHRAENADVEDRGEVFANLLVRKAHLDQQIDDVGPES